MRFASEVSSVSRRIKALLAIVVTNQGKSKLSSRGAGICLKRRRFSTGRTNQAVATEIVVRFKTHQKERRCRCPKTVQSSVEPMFSKCCRLHDCPTVDDRIHVAYPALLVSFESLSDCLRFDFIPGNGTGFGRIDDSARCAIPA